MKKWQKRKLLINNRRSSRGIYVSVFSTAVLILSTFMPLLSVNAAQFENRSLQMSSSDSGNGIGSEGPGGGLIFHIDGSTAYEAAPEGWDGGGDPRLQWGCSGQSVPGASGTAIGTGASNTQAIVDFHDNASNFGGNDYYAYSGDYEDIGCSTGNNGEVIAKYIDDANINGYSDWFLPSLDEAGAMYQSLASRSLGGFSSAWYWTSQDTGSLSANAHNMGTGQTFSSGKTASTYYARPARTFTHTPEPTTHTFNFDISTTASVGAFRFEYCTNDPFPGETCDAPLGLDTSDFTINSQSGATGFTKDATNTTTNEIVVTNSPPQSLSSSTTITFAFDGIINPSDTNTEFFVRIYSYDGDDVTTASVIDDGGLASSTAEAIDVTARVQETMQFCIYTGANCDAGGSEVDLGILNTTTTETGDSYFDIGTNARNGVTVQYIGTTLEGGGHEIDAFDNGSGNLASSETGTEQFGIRISNIDTTGSSGQNAQEAGVFNLGPNYALDTSGPATIADSTGPIETTIFTIEYAANVDALTPTGVYTTSLEYVATGQF